MKHRITCVDDDLMYEILGRLPIKALLKFKSVCKSWKKMIEDPQLGLKQVRRPTEATDLKLLMVHYSKPVDDDGSKDLTAVISSEMIEIAAPRRQFLICDCNGLYLFSNHKLVPRSLVLFNPLTQETLELPQPPLTKQRYLDTVTGLGFDVENALFKVIRFTIDLDYVCRKPQVLILGHKSWKQFELPACLQGIPHGLGAIFLNGVIYCLFGRHGVVASSSGDHDYHDQRYIIVAFDVIKEEFRSVKPPNLSESEYGLINAGDSLAMCLARHDFPRVITNRIISIWVLKDYDKGEWCVERKVITAPTRDSCTAAGTFLLISGGYLSFHATINRHVSRIFAHAPRNQLSLVRLSQY